MAVTQGFCKSFKRELIQAVHDLDNDTLKIALFDTSADLGADTTAYSTTNEVSGTGYTAGGAEITIASGYPKFDPNKPTEVVVATDDVSWPGATFTARAGLIYNSSKANRAIMVLDFGAGIPAQSAAFTIYLSQAINDLLRI